MSIGKVVNAAQKWTIAILATSKIAPSWLCWLTQQTDFITSLAIYLFSYKMPTDVPNRELVKNHGRFASVCAPGPGPTRPSDPARGGAIHPEAHTRSAGRGAVRALAGNPPTAAFCTRPAFVHGAEMAESHGRQAVV
jgi:hypothetical protein